MILLIEDDAELRDGLAGLLRDEGLRVVTAENGHAAGQWLKSTRVLPHVIVLDLLMPVMNGWEFYDELRRDLLMARIPMVIISAVADVREHSVALQAADHLVKPFSFEALLTRVRRHLPVSAE